MADLSEIQASQSVKLAGAGPSTGVETNYVQVDAVGNLQTASTLSVGGQNRNQAITTSAAEALGAAVILTNRDLLTITPIDGTVYWGYGSGTTSSNGTPIFKNQTLSISVSDNVHIYLITSTGTVDCRISEGA